MTIGIDIRVLMDAQYSGVGEYTYNLVQAILAEDKVNDYVLFYNSAHDVSARLPKFDYPNVRLIGKTIPNKLLNYGLFKIANQPKLDKWLGVNLDVFLMPHLNFIAWPNAKNILTVHDLSFLRYQEFFSMRKNFWHRAINSKKLIKDAGQIVAISESTKRDIMELAGVDEDKIKVIYSGVAPMFKLLTQNDSTLIQVKNKYQLPDRFILSLGNIEPRKNLVGLIEGYNKLRQDYAELSDVALVLAGGDGWKVKGVYRAAKSSPYTKDIKFLNYIEAEEKPAIYSLAGVLAFPSFYEGFGFPPLEAMACGTPVVASFASSIPEVVGEAGILIDPYDTAQISEALAQVLLDKNLADRLSQAGLIRAKNFNWQTTAKQYLEIFNK
jgi:glycosyltransferase involved in cell wall biosynthesis